MNEKTRNDVLKRNFETTSHIKAAIAACDKHGISYSLDHIFGIPFEREEEFKKTAEFFVSTRADRLCCYALFYYPKVQIIQSAKEDGLLNDKDIDDIEEGKAKLYVYGSSLKDADLKTFNNFRKLYSLAPLLPKKFNLWMLKSGFYKNLKFLPRFFTLIFESVSAISTRHPRGRDYLKYYFFHIKKWLLGK